LTNSMLSPNRNLWDVLTTGTAARRQPRKFGYGVAETLFSEERQFGVHAYDQEK